MTTSGSSNTAVEAILNGSVGNNKIIEDALAENTNGSLGTLNLEKTSQSHSLEFDSALGKNVGDATEG